MRIVGLDHRVVKAFREYRRNFLREEISPFERSTEKFGKIFDVHLLQLLYA